MIILAMEYRISLLERSNKTQPTENPAKIVLPDSLYEETDKWNLGSNTVLEDKYVNLVSMDVISTGYVYSKELLDVNNKKIADALVLKTKLNSVSNYPEMEFYIQYVPLDNKISINSQAIKDAIDLTGRGKIQTNDGFTLDYLLTVEDATKLFEKNSKWRFTPYQKDWAEVEKSLDYNKSSNIKDGIKLLELLPELEFNSNDYINYMYKQTNNLKPMLLVNVKKSSR